MRAAKTVLIPACGGCKCSDMLSCCREDIIFVGQEKLAHGGHTSTSHFELPGSPSSGSALLSPTGKIDSSKNLGCNFFHPLYWRTLPSQSARQCGL